MLHHKAPVEQEAELPVPAMTSTAKDVLTEAPREAQIAARLTHRWIFSSVTGWKTLRTT